MSFNLIVAYTKESRGIGFENKLPWDFNKKDMEYFKEITSKTDNPDNSNAVIMGRNTWDSLPKKPLLFRKNIIITRKSTGYFNNKLEFPNSTFSKLDHALSYCENSYRIEKVFIIGGEQLYKEAIYHPKLNRIYATEILEEYTCDTFFPKLPGWVKKVSYDNSDNVDQSYIIYENVADPNSEEQQYLRCLRHILKEGEKVKDRTGTGTLSVFDYNFNFKIDTLNPDEEDQTKIKYRVPALTTKTLYLKGIIWELIWFLRGETDAKWLSERGVRIWDGHTSRAHLDNMQLNDYKEGQLGPGYGHQWINWGAEWTPNNVSTGGVNQIKYVIDLLRKSPSSRRAVLSAWNVSALPKMSLPPCHILYIFKVTNHNDKKPTLNCKMVMRSNDMFLGSPFNIMSTAILTILISRALNMLPGRIAISICDSHLYLNHLDQAREQLERVPLRFPIMQLNKSVSEYDDMFDLNWDDFKFTDYYHWPRIKAEMAI